MRKQLLLHHSYLVAGFGVADHHLVMEAEATEVDAKDSEVNARDMVHRVAQLVKDVEVSSRDSATMISVIMTPPISVIKTSCPLGPKHTRMATRWELTERG